MDLLLVRLVHITLAFPSIVLALAVAAALGPSLRNALIAMILMWWPEYARVMRGQVLSVKNEDYVLAARSIGIADHRIMLRRILPNSWTPLIVKALLDAGGAILTVAALSFIGLGFNLLGDGLRDALDPRRSGLK